MVWRCPAIAFVAVAACSQPAPPPPADRTIRLAASSASGNFYSDGKAISDAVQAALPHLHIDVLTVGGGIRNVNLLREGKTDLAFSFSNVAYSAYMGEPDTGVPEFRDLRGIAVLNVAPLHLLVGPRSTIKSVSDLRGKRVNPGGPNSGAAEAFKVVARGYGLKPTDIEPVVTGGYDEGVTELVDGRIDAMFVLGDYPSDPVLRAINAGVHLVPIAGPEIDRLRADYQFFVPALIPARGYPGLATAIHTIGVESLLLCRADLAEDLVHDLTQAIFNSQGSATTLAESRHWSDVRQAAATPIPLHPGAARYYRERELSP
jgi:TRAP transporter TAXI family solute receptor